MSLYDKASIAMIPSGYKASTLYSVIPANGNGDFSHIRGNTDATRVNKDGLIENVSSNIPRLDYPLTNGLAGDCPNLLVEPSRTNISPDSERMDLWNSLRVTRTINSGVSPDGANTAVKVAMTSDTGEHSVYDGVSVSSGTTYTNSIFIKRGTGSADWQYFQFRYRNGGFGTGGGVVVDIHNGTITYNSGLTDYGIENYGNGWYRVYITQTATTTSSSAGPVLAFNEIANGYDVSIVGNINADVLIWGSQIEAGSYQTSYIKTSGGQVTRSSDAYYNSGTTADFNDSEGVLFVEIAALGTDGITKRLSVSSSGTSADYVIRIEFRPTENQIYGVIFVNPSNVAVLTHTVSDWTQMNKVAVKYKTNDFALWINGVEVSTDSFGSTGTGLGTLRLDSGSGGNSWYGNLKQLIYFNEALTDTELQTLTS